MLSKSTWPIVRQLPAAAALAGCLAAAAPAAGPGAGRRDGRLADLARQIRDDGVVVPRAVISLDLPAAPAPIVARVPLDDEPLTLALQPVSVRGPGYRLLVAGDDGRLVPHPAGPVRTLRGTVTERPGALVAGSLLDDGLHAVVIMPDGARHWIEPADPSLPAARPGDHLVYRAEDVAPFDVECGGPAWERPLAADATPRPLAATASGAPCVAELACDADFEYFSAYGTVPATEARINLVINTVNLQFEAEVGVTHQVTTIVVRSAPGPYTSTIAATRLCEFITEWTNNQGAVPRDLAQLFTGVDLDGQIVGLAADIGNTGLCVATGTCNPLSGSYSIVESDYNGSFACATDLSAHELGHLWGASHCTCPNNTMNPTIGCSNTFTSGSVADIVAYRDTLACLDGACPPPPPAPRNDDCASAEPFNAGAGDGVVAYDTTFATTDGPDNPAGQCNDSGAIETNQDIWFTYIATCTGTLTVTTCNDLHGAGVPSYDTDLVVYGPYADTGSIDCTAPGLAADLNLCNDDDPANPCGLGPPFSSTVTLPGVSTGEVYLVRVGGFSTGEAGTGWLSISCAGSATGACCLGGGGCSVQTEADCILAGGTYIIDGSTCVTDTDMDGRSDCIDGCPFDPDKFFPGVCGCGVPDDDFDSDGTPDCVDPCPQDPDDLCLCPQDCAAGGDGQVDVTDLLEVLGTWGTSGPCDTNTDGTVDVTDLLDVLGAWGACPAS
ncbi:MAG: M12 family metallo-peptidase [Planctomycetota bacterium]